MLIRRVSTHLRYYSCISRMFSGGIHRCKINRDSLVSEQITNHRPARIAESSPPQQGARRIIISVTSDTSDRCSLAPPAASRLCASWKSTAIFRANSSEAAKACHKGLRPPCANPALKSTNASINSARCFVDNRSCRDRAHQSGDHRSLRRTDLPAPKRGKLARLPLSEWGAVTPVHPQDDGRGYPLLSPSVGGRRSILD